MKPTFNYTYPTKRATATIRAVTLGLLCCCLLAGSIALAQGPPQGRPKSQQGQPPAPQAKTVKPKEQWAPSGLRLGFDLSNVALSVINDEINQIEAHADIDFGRFFLTGDFGISTRERIESDFTYKTDGTFYRFGVDYNITNTNPDRSVIFFGARIAQANYDDNLIYSLADSAWGNQVIEAGNPGLSVRWFEFNTGMKVRVWHQLYLGYTVRFKFSKQIKGTDAVTPYDIPGFGRANQTSAIGINYHIFYRIPWRNKPIPPKITEN